MTIPLSSPDITEEEIAAVVEVLRTPRLSLGPKLEEFEQAIATYSGAPYAVGLSSGTAGLHLALAAMGIGEGDEVVLPSFTFIAVAHAIRYVRATPVFAEIDPVTLNLTAGTISAVLTARTRAIVVVHTFGCPVDLQPILDLAAQRGIRVIEDACEALGAEYRNRKAGSLGDAGIFAFYPNKPITTGEGGMLVTADRQLAETIRALRNQGRRPGDGWLGHELLGYNYRLSEINCALGIAQMSRLEQILARRADRAAHYRAHLHDLPGVHLPVFETAGGRVCWFVFVIRVSGRDRVMAHLASRGIATGRYFAPLHRQPLYAPFVKPWQDLAITDAASESALALPFFNGLTDTQIAEVAAALRDTMVTFAP